MKAAGIEGGRPAAVAALAFDDGALSDVLIAATAPVEWE
jgi:hypothetical protein